MAQTGAQRREDAGNDPRIRGGRFAQPAGRGPLRVERNQNRALDALGKKADDYISAEEMARNAARVEAERAQAEAETERQVELQRRLHNSPDLTGIPGGSSEKEGGDEGDSAQGDEPGPGEGPSAKPTNPFNKDDRRDTVQQNQNEQKRKLTGEAIRDRMKAAANVVKQAATKAFAWLAGAVGFWPAVAIVAAISAIVLLAVWYGAGYVMTQHFNKVGYAGATTHQPVDWQADQGVIAEVLRAMNDIDATGKMNQELLTRIKEKIIKPLNEDPKTNTVIREIVGRLDGLVSQYTSLEEDKRPAKGLEIKNLLQELYKKLTNNLPQFPAHGDESLPLVSIRSFNSTPHQADGHGTIILNYNTEHGNPYRCEAVDINGKEDDDVYSVFGGKVVAIFPGTRSRPDLTRIVISRDNWHAVYLHVVANSDISVGKEIAGGVKIGKIKHFENWKKRTSPHIHLEVAYHEGGFATRGEGIYCIRVPEMYINAKTGKGINHEIGYYLWQTMVEILQVKNKPTS